MKFQKRSACMLGLLLVFACMAGYAVPARATAGEYSSLLRILPGLPGGRRCGRRSAATPGCRRAALAVPFQPGARPAGGLPGLRRMPGLEYCPSTQAQALATYRSRPERPPGIEAGAGRRDSYPVSIRTLDGRLLACNRNYLESLRMTREQARGTLLTDSDWVEGSKARLMHQQCLAVARGGTASFTDMAVRIGGQLLEIHHWVTPYRGSPGPGARPDERLDRHHRTGAPGPPVARGRCARRARRTGEERLPGDHEPRDPVRR